MKKIFAVLLMLCVLTGTLSGITVWADELSEIVTAISGSYSVQATEWELFDMAANGMSGNLVSDDVVNYLKNTSVMVLDEDRITNLAKASIILTALGFDATKITGANGELVSIIDKIAGYDGFEGINEAIFSLIAYDCGNYTVEAGLTRETIIDYILGLVNADGGWALMEEDEFSDPDVTSMVIWALAPYYDSYTEIIDNAVLCLSNMQQEDGQVASWGTKNSNSAAAIIIALSSLGIDSDLDVRFIKNDISILDALLSYKTPDNMFGYSDNTYNGMATEQGFRALVAYNKYKENGAYNIFSIDYEPQLPTQSKTVSLRIEGVSENKLDVENETVSFDTQNITVADVVKILAGSDNYVCQDTGYGEYFSSLYGDQEGTFRIDYDGWQYRVNGETPSVGASSYYVKDNDEILFYYGGMGIAYPNSPVITYNNKIAKIEFTYEKVSYGGAPDYAMTITTEPLTDAIITVDGALRYTTDENGAIGIPYKTLKNGIYSLQVSKANDDGLPLVVRFDPDYEIEIKHPIYNKPTHHTGGGGGSYVKPAETIKEEVKDKVQKTTFADLGNTHWAYTYIEYLTQKGVINGKENNKFCPEDNITRAEYVTLLYRLSGEETEENSVVFDDVSTDDWYFDAVMWAFNNKITNGVNATEFCPDNNITREEMAVLTVRFLDYSGKTLTNNGQDKQFNDQDDISGWAVAAVEILQNAEVLNGDGDYNFNPLNGSTRAETAKILYLITK
ncbi:MAG: S-layer homology domain-containing protein [Clostridia bacterium]|nr:S-layer homology domain-containing protein [Clostridia bacterium]